MNSSATRRSLRPGSYRGNFLLSILCIAAIDLCLIFRMARYYGHAKFTSFTRRLKRWNFTRIPSGPFMGAYVNVNFVRGQPDRARMIR